jgi:biotin operon repressor
MKELGESWIARDSIQDKLDISRNTIKDYCQTLSGAGLIEGAKGRDLNADETLKIYDNNRYYYRRCQKGVKKPILRCHIPKLREFLVNKIKQEIDAFILQGNTQEKGINLEGIKTGESKVAGDKIWAESVNSDRIDTFNLTPSENNIDFSKSSIKEDLENG